MIMKATETLKKIQKIMGIDLSEKKVKDLDVTIEKIELARLTLENGTIVEAETWETGVEVFIVTDDDRVPVPIGEYTIEDGRTLVIKEEGLIEEVREVETEEVTEKKDEKTEEVTEEKIVEASYPSREEFDELKLAVEEIQKGIEELTGRHKKELSDMEQKLSETPAADPIIHSPENKSNEAEILISPNRVETTLDRIFKTINN